MCSYITHTTAIDGSAKGPAGWFRATRATVYFDHPYHAPDAHTLNIDISDPDDPGRRVAVELSRESAVALMGAVQAALDSAEF